MTKRNRQSNKRDNALDKTFPASDPVAQGGETATERPKAPMDRKPPLISRENGRCGHSPGIPRESFAVCRARAYTVHHTAVELDGDLDRICGPAQRNALQAAACDIIREEKVSGSSTAGREQLAILLDFIAEGDTLVVTKLDRLARSTLDMLMIITKLGERGVQFVSLAEPWANTDSPASKLMLTVMAGIAEFERGRIRERQREGIVLAKNKGVFKGGKVRFDPNVIHQRDSCGIDMDKYSLAELLDRWQPVRRDCQWRAIDREATDRGSKAFVCWRRRPIPRLLRPREQVRRSHRGSRRSCRSGRRWRET